MSLTNQRIRIALKHYDSEEVAESVLLLVNGNQEKANLLAEWFRKISSCFNKGVYLNEEIAMMRMWQLGNLDIQTVNKSGVPIFVLTFSGSSIIKDLPEEDWFGALLWDPYSSEAA